MAPVTYAKFSKPIISKSIINLVKYTFLSNCEDEIYLQQGGMYEY